MTSFESMMDFSEFKLNDQTDCCRSSCRITRHNEVLMLAYMDEEAF